jgi:hypothetical protein
LEHIWLCARSSDSGIGVYGLPVALSFDLQRAKPVIEQLFWHRDYRVVTDHPISPVWCYDVVPVREQIHSV